MTGKARHTLSFCGLFDFFALWLASDVSSTDLQVNYVITFGDTLRDGPSLGKLPGCL